MTSDQLVMYVTNTGSMYATNCNMARCKASFQQRYDRTARALSAYRREFKEPYEGMSDDELQDTARALKAHYEQHVREV